MNKTKVIVEESLAQKLVSSESPQLLAGFSDDGIIYVTDSIPIGEGTHVEEFERILENRRRYPTENRFGRGPGFPGMKKKPLGTYGIYSVSSDYGMVVLKQDSELVAFNYTQQEKMRPLELSIQSF